MKKIKAPSQVSKISDFFSKAPCKNGGTESKRKLPSPENVINNGGAVPKCKKTKHDENCTPQNLGCNFQVVTPEKRLKPSTSMKTPTPKKNITPESCRKGTPKKLFEKSPRRLEEFNVQLLEAFLQVSPSTSNKTVKVGTPSKVKGLMKHKKCSPAQNHNETTPFKSPKVSLVSPNFKTKLSFLESIDGLVKQEKMDRVKVEIDDFFDDGFESLLDLEEDFKTLNLKEPQHCTVTHVNDQGDGKVVLKLKSNRDGVKGSCTIKEFWASASYFKPGDTIYINAEQQNSQWVVNNEKGWLVYEPDFLIPCTSVVGSLFCKRKAVLCDRYRGFDPSNRIMLIGVLAHSLLQQSLKNKLKTPQEIETLMKNLLVSKDTVKKLYEVGLKIDELESELQVFIPKLVSFIGEYVSGESRPEAANWQGRIQEIDDIEENLWCAELGVKGKIDVTVQTGNGVMPLELKTGRASVSLEHRGQVVLYIMMMNKFGYKVTSGLLLYLREGVLKEIKATPQEQRDVMILRNELAYFLGKTTVEDVKKPLDLPEPLSNRRICSKCPYNIICTAYLEYEKHDLSHNKDIQEVQNQATSHLNQAHLDYFLHWSNLLTMEGGDSGKMTKSLRQIYTVAPSIREATGRCIINVRVTLVGDDQNGLYEHSFEKDLSNFMASEIVENNYVVVSTNSRPAVATGFVTFVSPSKINILLDRNLNNKYEGELFHIDTYDSSITYTFNMTSTALLLENTPRAAQLRSIIIDKNPPTFLLKLPSVVAKKGASILRRLNVVQQKAVLKALCANEYLLIKGMPGTGKSATIVALIQLLVELGKSVLLTSHTHSAIDNICLRLQKRGVDFLRLGSESKIDANLKSNSEATLLKDCTTPEQMQEVYNKYNVITVTCLGSGHPLLSKRTFDMCIVDESTQVLQTSVIKPLYSAKTFVLIGDPDQLAPVVRNRDALEAGMSETIFERLKNPDGTITLNLNYRMNKTLTDLANIFTYGGELKTATEEIANRTLSIPHIERIKADYQGHPWLLKAVDTSLDAAVQFIDTGPIWKYPQDVKWHLKNSSEYDAQTCVNVHEVAVVVTLVKALIRGGVSSSEIGVIATYRAQVNLITKFLSDLSVHVSTVDKFQGRDKNVVVYSCTKSTDVSKVTGGVSKLELLEDKKRLTVAITRAKRKLLIVGDASTLQRFSTFSVILPALKGRIIEFDSSWSLVNNF